ncbi:MAG: mercury methylation corrinoid protein HgcA [Pirellulales bacterium]
MSATSTDKIVQGEEPNRGATGAADKECCCNPSSACQATSPPAAPWIVGSVSTPIGDVPVASTRLKMADRLGAWKARWGIGRMQYRVAPGLYAVGNPAPDSPVLVSANYKLSFDRLRSHLSGLDAWIMVVDTKGVNVWCSAGKGTFCDDEVVRRIEAVRLPEVVSARKLILPQLSAAGVAAHEVRKRSGFHVVFGPVRADDVPAFLAAGMQATPEMRDVQFPMGDRLAVIPVELVQAASKVVLVAACFFLLAGLGRDGYSASRAMDTGLFSATLFLLVCLASLTLTPLLLPWLPGRAFAIKGAWLGIGFLVALMGYKWPLPGVFENWFVFGAWCLILPAVASFAAINFTGCTTFTSVSGARREVRVAVPIQAAFAGVGVVLWLVGRFV